MAIKLEVCSVIVPIDKIREKLGVERYDEFYSRITDITWHDDFLFREGCMDGHSLGEILDKWEQRGFDLTTIIDGDKHWNEVCVVNSGHGPSYPCQWIDYDRKKNIVWYRGREPGEAIGPAGRKVFSEQ